LKTGECPDRYNGVDRCVWRLVELGLLGGRGYGKLRMMKPAFDSMVFFKKGMDMKIVRSYKEKHATR